jgi:hypothetical protein
MKALVAVLSLPLVSLAANPALTIYNQNFAVVRDTVPLDLKAGVNDVNFSGMTATAETDSVILRDPSGKVKLQVLEQSYRNDPVSQSLLLSLNEGKTIDFMVREPNKPDYTVQGKIVRSGYGAGGQNITEPVIEIDGKLQFQLPGMPVFPALGDDTILNPTLAWKLNANEDAKLDAELAYVTGGLSWHADYNLVAPEEGDKVDLVGWVTFDNRSGKTFRDAKIKLMAGDVNKIVRGNEGKDISMSSRSDIGSGGGAPITEKAFSEFHLYTIARPTTLRNQETKQVEFVRAQGMTAKRLYVYDGATMSYGNYYRYGGTGDYGIPTNKKVWVLREFRNSEANKLGIALPKGRLRFYQQDDDTSLQFIGENEIDHTPKDETVRVYVGNSFDLTGERRRTDYKVNSANDWMEEAFEIKVRNHKKEAVEIRVVEHFFRFVNWEVRKQSQDFTKLDSHTVEFRVPVEPDEEKIVTYRVHYSW